MDKQGYMFDTNIFNRILDGIINVNVPHSNAKFFATHVQNDELSKTPEQSRRQSLLNTFKEVTSNRIPTETFVLDHSRLDEARLGGENILPTESAVWDVSAWDQSGWNANTDLYLNIKSELDKLNKGKPNNVQDALIAETAIKNKLVLVTDDAHLLTIATKFGCKCNNSKNLEIEINRVRFD